MHKCIRCKNDLHSNWGGYCECCKAEFMEKKIKFCKKCQKTKSWLRFNKIRTKFLGLASYCKDCDVKDRRILDNFLVNLIKDAKTSSTRRKKGDRNLLGEFNITFDFIKKLWKEQNGLCALSNISMSHEPHSDFKCSIERLDNNTDYTQDNVILIILELNTVNQWTKDKIRYLKDVDITIEHPKINEIMSRSKLENLAYKYSGQYCITCSENQIFVKGLCRKCYKNKDINSILSNILYHARTHTKERNSRIGRNPTECNITLDDLWYQLQKQQGKCFYSGINMSFGNQIEWRVSLERLNNHLGYDKNNIVFICQEFNTGDKSILKTNYEKKGSSGWSKEKVDFVRIL